MKYKPDPESRRFILGGTLKEIPRPHVRQFPKYGVRHVTINVMKFYGIGVHYHVKIREGHNPIWDTKQRVWVQPWTDLRGEGRRFSGKFNTIDGANIFVKKIIKKHFNKAKYEFEYNGEGDHPKWLYRDGD